MEINVEQLKMILNAIQSAGENGKQMFILWVLIHYGAKLAAGLTIAGIGALGLKLVGRICGNVGQLEALRDTALPGRFAGTITDQEYRRTLERVRQLVAIEREWKKSRPQEEDQFSDN